MITLTPYSREYPTTRAALVAWRLGDPFVLSNTALQYWEGRTVRSTDVKEAVKIKLDNLNTFIIAAGKGETSCTAATQSA